MDRSRHDRTGGHGVGVGGRLRQRLAQILLHSSCATTSATAFVGVAGSANAAASRQEPPPLARCAHEQRPKPFDGRSSQRRRRRRSARALVHISIDCSARTVGAAVLPSPMPAARDVGAVKSGTRKKGNGADKARSPLYSWSSSTDTDGELAPFSSDGERGQATDTRSTLFSSHSFSSDSTADFYTATGACARPRRHTNPPRRAPPRRALRPADAFRPAAAPATAGKHDAEKKKRKLVERKDGAAVAAAGSKAVVKRSHNPYADFRSSMVEMVAGRRLRGADALSELLVWYLSLNSPRHHPAILAAFEDVWEAVLGNDP
ncbi:transcription repressor OFP8-like [Panicum virgatum]|uniref:Transcription repressor n=1 Tax=Panicum virgatum TaxID=38727 RepID=A0A8T0ULV6_PANVG|nr:transcription repressor OFP8-like [Panicum virgatum]KAG2625482.1 hypothetical protein PVAP13_3KG206400 [Panicum virgatum]